MKVILNWEKPFDITVELTSCKGDIRIGEGMLVNDMYAIKNYVRACEIAEYIKDNYEIETDARAIELGIEVRDLMLDDELPEDEAICEVLERYGYLDEPRFQSFDECVEMFNAWCGSCGRSDDYVM